MQKLKIRDPQTEVKKWHSRTGTHRLRQIQRITISGGQILLLHKYSVEDEKLTMGMRSEKNLYSLFIGLQLKRNL